MAKITEVKIVCDLLNGIASQENKSNPLYSKAVEIANFVKKKFGNVTKAINTENNFSGIGDFTIVVNNQSIDLEMKKLESGNKSKGTLANTSQNILSELHLINEDISWSEWRKKHGYDSTIFSLLNKYPATEKISKIPQKARIVRKTIYDIADKYSLSKAAMASLIQKIKLNYFDKLDPDQKLAVEIVDQIIDFAKKDLLSYLSFCKSKGINLSNIKKMIFLLKCGYHTLPLLKKKMTLTMDDIFRENRHYFIIYFYPNQEIIDKRFRVEGPKEILEWMGTEEITAEIEGESMWIKKGNQKMLQFKFHWRNVFFGISTPSVEIFDRT